MDIRIIDEEANYFLLTAECEDCLQNVLNIMGGLEPNI